jgi:hypothetical protein
MISRYSHAELQRADVNRPPYGVGNLLTSRTTNSTSRRALLYGIGLIMSMERIYAEHLHRLHIRLRTELDLENLVVSSLFN